MSLEVNMKSYFKTYGLHNIKARCRAEGFRNSNFTEITVDNQPALAYKSTQVLLSNLIKGIEEIKFYIDGALVKTIPHDSTLNEDLAIDLTEFELEQTTIYNFKVEVVGPNLGTEASYFTPEIQSVKVLGVSGMYSSSTLLTRTDNAVGLSYVIDSSTGNISSDFDNEFPYVEMQKVTIGDNVFVKVPTMYFRVGTDSSSNITDIAVCRIPVGDGNWYKVDEFYYGAYGGYVSNSKLCSKTGVARTTYKTIGNFRSYASNNGTGYQQLDIYHKTVMNFLWLIEFANKDSSSIMSGNVSYGSKATCGGTDSNTNPSAYNTFTKQMRYRYIEDFVGNTLEFLDGIYQNYYTSNPSNFSDGTAGKVLLSYDANLSSQCLAAWGWDTNNPFLCKAKTVINYSSYNTYFCDYVYYPDNNYPVCYCGSCYNGSSSSYGLFYVQCDAVSMSNSNVGARLLYIPD